MFEINNKQWFIKFVPQNYYMLFNSVGANVIGCCDDNTKTIYLNKNLTGNLLKKVLCHEITHAAMFSYNITLSLDQEELLADLIATYGEEIISITNKIFKKLKRDI